MQTITSLGFGGVQSMFKNGILRLLLDRLGINVFVNNMGLGSFLLIEGLKLNRIVDEFLCLRELVLVFGH
jgi:hypothetical protein